MLDHKLTKQEKLDLIYSLDDYDYNNSKFNNLKQKDCSVCHRIFYDESKNNSQKCCKRTHIVDCVICGSQIIQKTDEIKSSGPRCACKGQCSKDFRYLQTKYSVLAKYGCENVSQVPELKDKIKEGLKKVAPEVSKKSQKTMKEKYGGMGTASPVLRAKIEATMQEKYGVTNPDELPEFRKKISDKLKSVEVIEKRKKSSRIKYGTDFPSQSQIVQQEMMNTTMARWGVPYTGQIADHNQKVKQTCLKKYGVPCTLLKEDAREKARQAMLENQTGRASKINALFVEKMKENGFDPYPELYIGRKSFDCGLVDRKIVIEIDPSYTHSTVPSHWEKEGKPPTFHLERTRIANEAGYHCIHIFDWESWDKVIDMLKQQETIYARKCILQEIDEKSASQFINMYHIQGRVNGTKKAYALFYTGEMVEVMTFGKSRYNKKFEWELLRLCTKTGLRVSGGASRLFNQFIKDCNPSSIISYCDLSKFSGSVYEKLGFVLDHKSSPAKVWSKGSDYVTDNLLRQRGYDQLFNTNYGKGTSNEDLMIQHGWLPVYDCGQAVYSWLSLKLST